LLDGTSIINLFPKSPTLFFRPEQSLCSCGRSLTVSKTESRIVFVLSIGEFQAHETILKCDHCQKNYASDELKRLVPDGANYGFDILEHVGRSLFLKSRNEKDIQNDLLTRGVRISPRQIGYLGSKFVIYLALCHEEICPEIKKLFQTNGGFILHIDGTCEGSSPMLVNVIDGITGIVLSSVKVASEKKESIVSILKKIKKDFGIPLAMMHDMGKGNVSACEEVFEDVLDFICQLHFLRDIGKDFFGQEYSLLFNCVMRKYKVCSMLRAEQKRLSSLIERDFLLTQNLRTFEKSDSKKTKFHKLLPANFAYVLISWILDYEGELNGYGFPFDCAYLILYNRLEGVLLKIHSAKKSIRSHKQLSKLISILNKVLNDAELTRNVREMEKKVATFEKLRKALKIALSEGRGLNDNGEVENMRIIKSQMEEFRQNEELNKRALKDSSYKKLIEQIDKYWEKLFADPIQIHTLNGIKVIYPQRTNNIVEQFFRKLKMLYRKRQGTHKLTKTLKAMIAETPFVQNLEIPAYATILLKGKFGLADRFAGINVKLVRERLKTHNNQLNKITPQFKKLLSSSDFLQHLSSIAR